MAHFGTICPPIPGHINPACSLGRALLRRGHRVTVFHIKDLAPAIQAQGLEFVSLGQDAFPEGALAESVARMKALNGLESVRYAIEMECRLARAILTYAPDLMRDAGLDGLMVDQNEPAGGSVAEYLAIPFVSLCTSLPLNREASIPPPFASWQYSERALSRLRNRVAYRVVDHLIRNIQATLNEFRSKWHLPLLRSPNDSFSSLAQIAQMPRELDFPNATLPATFHYTGPWFDEHTAAEDFPYEQLDGRPLVYASLGTLQDPGSRYFHMIAEACTGLDLQAVITVGAKDRSAVPVLPGRHIVVHSAPQIALLRRSAMTITHAGMNTTMQALSFGCPLVAIPLTHDQPAIAARLARAGAGMVIPPAQLTVDVLRSSIQMMLQPNSPWQLKARVIQEALKQAGGVERAADIAEQAMLTPRTHTASA